MNPVTRIHTNATVWHNGTLLPIIAIEVTWHPRRVRITYRVAQGRTASFTLQQEDTK